MQPLYLISRRQFMLSFGGLALAAGLPGCDGLDRPISLAAHTRLGYEALFLAEREGWLNAELASIRPTVSATASMQALMTGAVDGAALTLDEALRLRAAGVPVSLVLVFDVSAGIDKVVARPDIRQLSALKGRRVGYEANTAGALMLLEALNAAGLTAADIQPVSVGFDEHLSAWSNLKVDALITVEPVAGQLLAQGGVNLFDSRNIPDTLIDVLVVRQDKLGFRHAHAIRHVIAMYLKAQDYFNRNPWDAAYRMAEHLGIAADAVLPAFRGMFLPDATNNYRLLTGEPAPLLQTAAKLSAILPEAPLLQQSSTLKAFINADYLPKVF